MDLIWFGLGLLLFFFFSFFGCKGVFFWVLGWGLVGFTVGFGFGRDELGIIYDYDCDYDYDGEGDGDGDDDYIYSRMKGWMDGWMDGWKEGWMEGRKGVPCVLFGLQGAGWYWG